MSPPPSRGTIIEGVGDEVVYGFTGTLAGLAPLIAMLFIWNQRRNSPQTIHPDSQESVRNTRLHTRIERENPGDESTNSENTTPTPPRQERDVTCPICIYDAQYALETNCGHIFCGNCFVTYWRHGSWVGAVRCPVCRQQVTILLFLFTEEEFRTETPDRNEITRHVNSYNRRFSGAPRPWIDYIYDLPILLRHCLTEFFSVGGLIWMFRLRIIVCFLAALLYFVSPLDIIPEACFGLLGFLDDFFILLLLAIYISIMYRRIVESRAEAAMHNNNDVN